MTRNEASILKLRITGLKLNEQTKKVSIKRIFAVIDSMTEPDTPHMEIRKYLCPKCGTMVSTWRMKL